MDNDSGYCNIRAGSEQRSAKVNAFRVRTPFRAKHLFSEHEHKHKHKQYSMPEHEHEHEHEPRAKSQPEQEPEKMRLSKNKG